MEPGAVKEFQISTKPKGMHGSRGSLGISDKNLVKWGNSRASCVGVAWKLMNTVAKFGGRGEKGG